MKMRVCRYDGRCVIQYDTDFDTCYPCIGDGADTCASYEPYADREALLAIADDIDGALDDSACGGVLAWMMRDISGRIREACGEAVG